MSKKIIIEINTDIGNEEINLDKLQSIVDPGDVLILKAVGNGCVFSTGGEDPFLNSGQIFEIKPEPEPKVPTHEEIMNPDRYWRGLDSESDIVWEKVTAYMEEGNLYYIHDEWKDRDYFSGRSFEDGIPPEVFK